jgi:hypothetical protein
VNDGHFSGGVIMLVPACTFLWQDWFTCVCMVCSKLIKLNIFCRYLVWNLHNGYKWGPRWFEVAYNFHFHHMQSHFIICMLNQIKCICHIHMVSRC